MRRNIVNQRNRFRTPQRRGVTVVLFAILLSVVLVFVALCVDLGYVCTVKGDLQGAVDAGALAGTGMLPDGEDVAEAAALKFTTSNLNNRGVRVGPQNTVDVQVGHWNSTARTFTPGGSPQDSVKVIATAHDTPLFFGRAVGSGLLSSEAHAVAVYRPRDIMLVLDVSGSMDDSNNGIRKIDELRDAVSFFLGYIRDANSRDRIGFTYYSTTAHLGMGLSYDLDAVEQALMQELNPDGYTNISDGMMLARQEMNQHRRAYAAPLMVVLTDGAANTIQPEDIQDIPEAKSRVIVEANTAKQDGIPVFTMALDSLTEDVDVALMAQVAEITGSESYHIIAGESDGSGNPLLQEAFRRVALNRPLRLVE